MEWLCFQRTINDIIDINKLKDTFAYVDNIGHTQEELDLNLQRFQEIAKKHNLTFNESKSVISTNTIDLLWYTISHGQLKPDAERIRPLKELPLPNNQAAINRVRGFSLITRIGLVTYPIRSKRERRAPERYEF